MRYNRRSFLASLGLAGVAGLAGCTSPDEPSDTTTSTEAPPVTTVDDPAYDLGVTHDVQEWAKYDPDWSHPTAAPNLDVTTETVVEGLKIPWDLSFAPNGDLFITERPGRLLRYESGTVESVASPNDIVDARAIDVDDEGGWWAAGGEGGLMGNAIHPNYPEVPLVYAFYTYVESGETLNKLVYYDVSSDESDATTVIEGIPGESYHNGSRITFGPENYLWVTMGDAGQPALAQDPSSLVGKVLRLNPDGSAPEDNPDLGGDPRVFTYGHRNPQGLTFMPDATPVENEHGPAAHDEVNVLSAGENYGWDVEGERARTAETYRGTDYARPLVNTGNETWAPPGSVFYTGDAVPSWQNRLVIGGLISQRINLVTIYPTDGEPASAENGGTRFDADWMDPEYSAAHHTALEDELGRIRHVEQGPDGTLYAVTSNRDGRAQGEQFPREVDDRLVRITPA
ncbi:PQQ-dependent sugar dehydrogenase [Halobacterium noricense]|uniref:PQQ-dependent sugar dehydrogenase n=1 Tax=Halobacterium noricense TaxID=223182 RepID=UPI001E5E5CF9|nr:PQQ-dependent sugar dehydrogenase [Halobacterium noricense]UHH25541.1 PQQ-dependent sugar dehydrogenase [Halobacterium noricense]